MRPFTPCGIACHTALMGAASAACCNEILPLALTQRAICLSRLQSCRRWVPEATLAEHTDWHIASELQQKENRHAGPQAPAAAAPAPVGTGSKPLKRGAGSSGGGGGGQATLMSLLKRQKSG